MQHREKMKIKLYLILFFSFIFIFTPSVVFSKNNSSRLAGENRYATSCRIAGQFGSNVHTVVLARGDIFPDALSGVPLAAKYNAPILLTSRDDLNEYTKLFLESYKINEVFILGSEDALSENIVSQLNNMSITNIHRIGGSTRYETSSLISEYVGSPENKTAIIATGENYPDALSVGSLSGLKRMPILLVRGDTGVIPESIKNTLSKLGIEKVVIVGGEDVVKQDIDTWLINNNFSIERRFSGSDRYATCKEVAEYSLLQGVKFRDLYVAYGENFPDALSLGALSAHNNAPIILVRDTFIPDSIGSFLNNHTDDLNSTLFGFIYIAGESDVVSDEVVSQLEKWGEGAPPKGKIDVLPNYSYRVNPYSGLEIFGEVKNNTTRIAEGVKITANLYSSGRLTGTKDGYSYIGILEPGDIAPFIIVFLSNPSFDNIVFSTQYYETNTEPYKQFLIQNSSITTDTYGSSDLIGEVKNTGSRNSKSVEVACSFYDASGKVVYTGEDYASPDSISPGQIGTFSIDLIDLPSYSSYKLYVQGQ